MWNKWTGGRVNIIVPNSYAAYTLGNKCAEQITINNIITIDEPTCNAAGSIQFEISGGSGDYEYSINGEPFQHYTGGVITGISAGYLTIDAKDVNVSCATAQASFTVPSSSMDFGITSISTNDADDCSTATGKITVNIEGNITTVRNMAANQRGMLSFAGTANWVSSNGSFVNGYVRSHKPNYFVFPVGQTTYRPAAISQSADAAPTDAAYYNTAQYSKTALGNGLNDITDESWIIQGTTAAVITLSWNTNLSTFADNLADLCVAGWDVSLSKWVEIASAADVTSPIFGTASALAISGTVSTTAAIVPNSYAAYTLGVRGCPRLTIENIATVTEPTCATAGAIQFEISGGSGDYEYSINGEPFQPYTGAPIAVPSAGYLTIEATDRNNPCDTARNDYTVPNNSQDFGISLTTEDAEDCSSATGKIIVALTGGEPPFTYTIDGGTPELLPADNIIADLPAGYYVVKITDGNDCSDSKLATITSSVSSIAITNFAVTADALCEIASGAISFSVSGCLYASYTYWVDEMLKTTASGGVHTVNNLAAGAHTLFVADSCGQTEHTFTIVLDATPAPIQADDAVVCAGETVTLTATAAGVTAPVFRWYESQTSLPPLHTGANFTISSNIDTAFYVSVSGSGYCENAPESRKKVSVTVLQIPDNILTTDILPASKWMPVDLMLAVDFDPALSYEFYENANKTGFISGSVVIFIPPKDDYYVVARNGKCEGALHKIILTASPCSPTITDEEGNVYKVTSLAGKCWTENLKTTKYPGTDDPIPFANPYTCNICQEQLDTIFGLLYTWNAAVGESHTAGIVQGICPDGWHIPSKAEWSTLEAYPASQLRSTQYWLNPPGGGTNDFGFDARPAGWYNGAINRYQDLYGFTGWWASDKFSETTANYYTIFYYCNEIVKEVKNKADGLSVRCVMD